MQLCCNAMEVSHPIELTRIYFCEIQIRSGFALWDTYTCALSVSDQRTARSDFDLWSRAIPFLLGKRPFPLKSATQTENQVGHLSLAWKRSAGNAALADSPPLMQLVKARCDYITFNLRETGFKARNSCLFPLSSPATSQFHTTLFQCMRNYVYRSQNKRALADLLKRSVRVYFRSGAKGHAAVLGVFFFRHCQRQLWKGGGRRGEDGSLLVAEQQ